MGLRLTVVFVVVVGALVAVLVRTAAFRLGREVSLSSLFFLTADRFTVTVLFVILSLAAAAAALVRGMVESVQ